MDTNRRVVVWITDEQKNGLPANTAAWTLVSNRYQAYEAKRELESFDPTRSIGIWKASITDWELERIA